MAWLRHRDEIFTGVSLAGVAYSPQCHQQTAILLLQLLTIMYRKRAIYSSNSCVVNYRMSGANKGILLTHETSCHHLKMFICTINCRANRHVYITTTDVGVARSV